MNLSKSIKAVLISVALLLPFFAFNEAMAAVQVGNNYVNGTAAQMGAFNAEAGMSAEGGDSVPNLIATIIKTVLGLLGIVFVVLIIIAGFKWMMAGGNEKDVDDAQKRIKSSIIGLIIILSAYAITAFVFNNLPSSSVSGSSGKVVGNGG